MILFKKSPEDLCREGEEFMAKQRFRKAIEKFVRAIELGGDDLSLVCVAELNIGSCYAMLNNHEKALEHTEKCLEILLGLLGLPLEVPEGREEGSFYRTLFSRSIGVMAYYNKGIIFKAMGRLDEARVIFDKLIKYLHPQFISQEPILGMRGLRL